MAGDRAGRETRVEMMAENGKRESAAQDRRERYGWNAPRETMDKRLAALGFAADWSSLSGDSIDGYGAPIDPIGRTSINGECRGIACHGQTRRELYRDMLREAKSAAPYLEPCRAADCEFHDS